jgi:hypothetical protein
MSDTTNIIATQTRIEMMRGVLNACRAPEYHQETLTALVAERDALLERVAAQDADIKTLAASNAILHGRLESHPPADRDRERNDALTKWMDQVTAMLCRSMTHSHDAKQELVTRCDAAIAAMRKGEA